MKKFRRSEYCIRSEYYWTETTEHSLSTYPPHDQSPYDFTTSGLPAPDNFRPQPISSSTPQSSNTIIGPIQPLPSSQSPSLDAPVGVAEDQPGNGGSWGTHETEQLPRPKTRLTVNNIIIPNVKVKNFDAEKFKNFNFNFNSNDRTVNNVRINNITTDDTLVWDMSNSGKIGASVERNASYPVVTQPRAVDALSKTDTAIRSSVPSTIRPDVDPNNTWSAWSDWILDATFNRWYQIRLDRAGNSERRWAPA